MRTRVARPLRHHRLRDQVHRASEAQQPRGDQDGGRDEREGGRERGEPGRVAVCERADGDGGESAEVAVVALTTSEREVPSTA